MLVRLIRVTGTNESKFTVSLNCIPIVTTKNSESSQCVGYFFYQLFGHCNDTIQSGGIF